MLGGQTWTGWEGPPSVLGQLGHNCADWTVSNAGIGRRGSLRMVSGWFQGERDSSCDAAGALVRLFCVEQ